VAADPASGPGDIVVGGHVQPIRTRRGGVLDRPDAAHAAVDLTRLAGLRPAAVISALHDADGALALRADVEAFCAHHGLEAVTLAEVIALRWHRTPLVRREVDTRMPTRFGDFTAIGYSSVVDGGHHVALVSGAVADRDDVLVSVHSECFTGDVLHSLRCDCRDQLESALRMIAADGGALVYVTHDDRLHELTERLAGDARPAPSIRAQRESGVATQILADLAPSSIRLLVGARGREPRLDGLRVTERIPLDVAEAAHVARIQTGRYA
jgi:3,4-dihydroxy 2-butanone 4-phosphate synthase/GTP cyclohydrolase II